MLSRSIVAGLLLAVALPGAGQAQVVTDGSYGPPTAVPGGTDVNGDAATYLIDESYGEQQGGNLFHSFEEFSVQDGETATFEGPASVDNVFSRVTGGLPSDIFGVLRSTIQGANLFLLNPSGVYIGPDARLDVAGSFHASTADAMHFDDETVWQTGEPGPLDLTAANPSAFGFTSPDPAPVTIDETVVGVGGVRETLPPGETLSLVGGDVTIAGRNAVFQSVRIESGTVQIASLAGPAVVPLDVSSFDVSELSPDALGTVRVTDGAFVNVEGSFANTSPGGRVVVRGGRFVMDGASQISSANFSDQDAGQPAVDVEVAGLASLDEGSIVLSTSFIADGRGGDVRLRAGELEVRNGATVNARSLNFDPAGGTGGDIDIQVGGRLRVDSGGQLAATSGDPLSLPDGGPGGELVVRADLVEVEEGTLSAATFGQGAAGGIDIQAREVQVSGAAASIASQGAVGSGGSVSIVADQLRVQDGAQISVSATGTGDAGNLRVVAQSVTLDGAAPGQPSGLLSQSISGASGAAGNIEMDVGTTLRIDNGAQISVSSRSISSGPSGSIDIRTGRLQMSNAVEGIRAASLSLNDAGNVTIRAAEEVKLQDSSISTEAAVASGGNIDIAAGDLIRIRRRGVSADTPLLTAEVAPQQTTAGGGIRLASKLVVVDRAGVRASAVDGVGGNIEVLGDSFLASGGNLLQNGPGFFSSGGEVFTVGGTGTGSGGGAGQLASTGAYFDVSGALDTGSFVLRSPEAAVVANLASLSQDFLDLATLQRNECAARREPVGSLTVGGRDRIPAAPEDRLRGLYMLEL